MEVVKSSAVTIEFGASPVDVFLFLGCGSHFRRVEIRVEWYSVVSAMKQLLDVYDPLGGWELSEYVLDGIAHVNISSGAVLYLLDVAITGDICQLGGIALDIWCLLTSCVHGDSSLCSVAGIESRPVGRCHPD